MNIYDKLVAKEATLAVIGLGYVGLPIALEFAKKIKVVGFDINAARIDMMKNNIDPSQELEASDFEGADIEFTANIEDLKKCDFYIVAVPTPIDEARLPDLKPLLGASGTVGKVISKGDYVVFESTVYPGCTEEDCIPVLEKESGLIWKTDFNVGYSPERINPGDKVNTLSSIVKVASGDTVESADIIANVYELVVAAGVHRAATIKVAEAAKIIENTQRDVNIALINELSIIFNKLGINTYDVLEAAGTKWNFLNFRPGLVGGHCIGVDPYYLAQKAQEVGYHPEIILSGRRMNDSMGAYIASEVVKLMVAKEIPVKGAKTLLLGITFKENCPDIRNTKAIDVYRELQSYHMDIDLYDPWANTEEVHQEFGINLITTLSNEKYDTIILTVAHKEFLELDISKMRKKESLIYDIKGVLAKQDIDKRL